MATVSIEEALYRKLMSELRPFGPEKVRGTRHGYHDRLGEITLKADGGEFVVMCSKPELVRQHSG